MASLERLQALTLAAIERAEGRLAAGDLAGWRRGMREAVATGHTAAAWAAVAERSQGPGQFAVARIRQWIGERLGDRAMPRADRERLRDRVAGQLGYLERMARELEAGQITPAQAMARGRMYAGATRETYYTVRWGAWEIPDRLMPGRQQCLTNCKCSISIRDNGDGTGWMTRTMGATEQHCDECPGLAGTYRIRRRRA